MHILSFLLRNMFKNRSSRIKKPKSFKNYLNVSRFKGKIPKTQEKNTKVKEKLKLWEDFAPPERPSGVIKKAWSCTIPAWALLGANRRNCRWIDTHAISSLIADCHAEIVSRRCLVDFLYRNLELHLEDAAGGPGEIDNSVFVKNPPEAGGGYKLKVKMSTILSF